METEGEEGPICSFSTVEQSQHTTWSSTVYASKQTSELEMMFRPGLINTDGSSEVNEEDCQTGTHLPVSGLSIGYEKRGWTECCRCSDIGVDQNLKTLHDHGTLEQDNKLN